MYGVDGWMEFRELWCFPNIKYYKWHKYQDSSVIENGKFFIDGFSGRIKIFLPEKCKN